MQKEICIKCGKETNVDVSTHVDFRTGYIEGVGQLCIRCYNGPDDVTEIMKNRTTLITVSAETILDTPNDEELGHKVRRSYWDITKEQK
jgi:hypothetical protein